MEVIVETSDINSNVTSDMSMKREMKLKNFKDLMYSESSYLFETSSASPSSASTSNLDFAVSPSASKPLKDFCMAFEPYGAKTVKGGELRREAFAMADTNGTGQVSFAEMDNFILHILKTKHGERGDKAETLFRLFRPCYLHAFNNVKKLQRQKNPKVFKGTVSATADDYICFAEFRVFTVSLRIHAAMYDIFCIVDGGTTKKTHNHDTRISLEEFVQSCETKTLNADKFGYAFKGLEELPTFTSGEDAKSLFQKIDTNEGGYILFSEWCTYLKEQEIAANTPLGILLSGNLKPIKLPATPSITPRSKQRKRIGTPATIATAATSSSSLLGTGRSSRSILRGSNSNISTATTNSTSTKLSKASYKKLTMIMPVTVAGAYKPRNTASSEDLRKIIQSFQPYAEKHPTSIALRKADFSTCDSNGSGKCTLSEIENYVSWVLKQDYGADEGMRLFRTFRPAYAFAYKGAKNLKKKDDDEDCIGFAEFRILNAYLCIYAGMLDSFQFIDGGCAGVDENDDRRIDKEEWMNNYGELVKDHIDEADKDDDDEAEEDDARSRSSRSSMHSKSCNNDFIAFSKVTDDESALAAFEEMDTDRGGVVRFTEFCDWIAREEMSRNTPLGKLLEGSTLQAEKLHVRGWRNTN